MDRMAGIIKENYKLNDEIIVKLKILFIMKEEVRVKPFKTQGDIIFRTGLEY
jgi:hypothetical protein